MAETRSLIDLNPSKLQAEYEDDYKNHPVFKDFPCPFWWSLLYEVIAVTGYECMIGSWLAPDEIWLQEGRRYPSCDMAFRALAGDSWVDVALFRVDGLLEGSDNAAKTMAHFNLTVEDCVRKLAKRDGLPPSSSLIGVVTNGTRFAMTECEVGKTPTWRETDSHGMPVLVDAAEAGTYELVDKIITRLSSIENISPKRELKLLVPQERSADDLECLRILEGRDRAHL